MISIRNNIQQPAAGAASGPGGLPNGARVVLAPLCGITDAVFRSICLDHGADMVVTEMVSSDAYTRGRLHKIRALKGLDVEQGPLAVQIFGGDPDRMGETAAALSEAGPAYLDLNFGCPVRKIVAQNGGSAVLRDLDLLGRICRHVVARSQVPVSAKIRTGWDKTDSDTLRDICRVIEDAGVKVLTVHARTRKQGFAGAANWDLIAQVKDAVSIPVVGNGDVASAQDFFDMHSTTGCDAVMIGRAALGNPWIFSEIRARLTGRAFSPPTAGARIDVLLEHVRRKVGIDGEPGGLITARKAMAVYVARLPGARELRARMMQIERFAELEELLRSHVAHINP